MPALMSARTIAPHHAPAGGRPKRRNGYVTVSTPPKMTSSTTLHPSRERTISDPSPHCQGTFGRQPRPGYLLATPVDTRRTGTESIAERTLYLGAQDAKFDQHGVALV